MPRDGAIMCCASSATNAVALANTLLTAPALRIDAKLFDWSDEITADCPRNQARNRSDRCGARCPHLSKVV
jgi:hypothetical protein